MLKRCSRNGSISGHGIAAAAAAAAAAEPRATVARTHLLQVLRIPIIIVRSIDSLGPAARVSRWMIVAVLDQPREGDIHHISEELQSSRMWKRSTSEVRILMPCDAFDHS